jgi:alkylphosphonate utilization operon protein PhnA
MDHIVQIQMFYNGRDVGRLVEGDHNIDCKIDGFGPMKLKSEFVKKN